jgi:hypothetical protein
VTPRASDKLVEFTVLRKLMAAAAVANDWKITFATTRRDAAVTFRVMSSALTPVN